MRLISGIHIYRRGGQASDCLFTTRNVMSMEMRVLDRSDAHDVFPQCYERITLEELDFSRKDNSGVWSNAGSHIHDKVR